MVVMILGIGTDIIEIARVGDKVTQKQGFKEAVFSATEIAYCESRKNKAESYAVRFAAKEAFLKALGIGIHGVQNLSDIEVIHDESGSPRLNLAGIAAGLIQQRGISHIHVSLSHSKEMACAFVVIEK